ncbi:MAG TPA: hypothetical protein VGQ76_17420 [Thermoanaerobaculia bacterium]|jgi:hypothetical protein|nr:hypothetical protein [Thermoanaerobaculia bacterium]
MRTTAFLLTSLLLCTTASADLITPQTSSPRILVPAAGNAPGANGTYFRSDIQIANLRNVTQRVQMFWLPNGSSGSGIAPRVMDLGAGRGFSSEDFVANVMLQTGVGSIEFVGVTEAGVFDPNARLHVSSRIWTPRPDGGDGTMSQTFPAVVMPGSTASSKTIFGIRHSSQYRINIGISNPTTTVHHFRVTAKISTPTVEEEQVFEVEVQPRSIEQRTVTGLTRTGVAQVLIENLTPGLFTDWQAWASAVDNFSGDAWSQLAFPTPAQQ